MQDSNPSCASKRQYTCTTFGDVFKRHGARCIETSQLQVRGGQEMCYGSCAGKIVNIDDPGGGGGGGEKESLCLRYDLTVPLIRYLINHKITQGIFYQAGPSFRLLPNGKCQEVHQCDLDIVGEQDVPMVSDALCIQVMYSALCELGFDEECVEIKVNHSKLLRGILSCCRIPAHLHSPLKRVLLSQDVTIEKLEAIGIEREKAAKLHRYLTMTGRMDLIQRIRGEDSNLMQNLDVKESIEEMEIFLQFCTKGFQVPSKVCLFHLGLVRELDYYNGLIFEAVFVDGCRRPVAQLASGGRYDDLLNKCKPGFNVPAVGFSLMVDEAMRIHQNDPEEESERSLEHTHPSELHRDLSCESVDSETSAGVEPLQVDPSGINEHSSLEIGIRYGGFRGERSPEDHTQVKVVSIPPLSCHEMDPSTSGQVLDRAPDELEIPDRNVPMLSVEESDDGCHHSRECVFGRSECVPPTPEDSSEVVMSGAPETLKHRLPQPNGSP